MSYPKDGWAATPTEHTTTAPAGVANMERLMNPNNVRVVNGVALCTCRICEGDGRSGAFICPACNGAGIVRIR